MRTIPVVLALLTACARHSSPGVQDVPPSRPPPPPQTRTVVVQETVNASFLKDTILGAGQHATARHFDLRKRAARDSLYALIKKQRALWRAGKPRAYRFLLRVDCFCPGTKGWLLIEARDNQPLLAWDRTGQPTAISDWNTLDLDALYDSVERSVERDGTMAIAFDARWHFPSYVHIAALPGPDMWAIFEARALRPL